MDKNEKKLKRQEKVSKALQNIKNKSNKIGNWLKAKKKLFFALIIGLISIVLILLVSHILITYENEHKYDNYIFVPYLEGYDEEDAIQILKDKGFLNISVKYIIDQYTPDKCVVKTNKHLNYKSRPDEEIIVYVCDKSLIGDNEMVVNPDLSATTKYFSMDNIKIVDMAIYKDQFYAIIQNNNTTAITKIQYKIGYLNENEQRIGENKYQLDEDIIILPGEKYTIIGNIKNKSAYSLYVSGLSYEQIAVPDDERIK